MVAPALLSPAPLHSPVHSPEAQPRSEGVRTAAIIFDMDGTMIDSMPWHTQAWVEFAHRHGMAIDVADLMARTTGRNGTECIRELLGREVSQAEADGLTHEKEVIYRELFGPQFTEVAGFGAFVQRVAERDLKVAIGTAGDAANVAFAMAHLRMAPSPLAIVRGDEGLPGKPSPDIFLEAARRLGVAPAHCIVFEDSPFGIEAARRAGMRAVAICSTQSAHALSGPHVLATVRDYTELMNTDFLETLHVAPE